MQSRYETRSHNLCLYNGQRAHVIWIYRFLTLNLHQVSNIAAVMLMGSIISCYLTLWGKGEPKIPAILDIHARSWHTHTKKKEQKRCLDYYGFPLLSLSHTLSLLIYRRWFWPFLCLSDGKMVSTLLRVLWLYDKAFLVIRNYYELLLHLHSSEDSNKKRFTWGSPTL